MAHMYTDADTVTHVYTPSLTHSLAIRIITIKITTGTITLTLDEFFVHYFSVTR